MSNKQIGVGDLVMVVKSLPCGCPRNLGSSFIVQGMMTNLDIATCSKCLKKFPVSNIAIYDTRVYRLAFPVECLKKINQPPTEEDIATHHKVEVPA